MMLAECSGVGMEIDLSSIPRPVATPLERWLQTFPSFGYIVSTRDAPAVVAQLAGRGIAAADVGLITADRVVKVNLGRDSETIWDFAKQPLLGCGHA